MAPQSQPQSSSNPPQPLSFPPSHFAKLAPRSYLHAHLSSPNGRRPSGRLPHESRKPQINTGSLTHCHGSAVVRAGDTAVVCGIRAEILNTSDVVDYRPLTKQSELEARYGGASTFSNAAVGENKSLARTEDAEELAHLNLLVPNVELSTGCSPSYLPGSPPSTEAQSLSHRVLTLLHSSQLLSMDDLRIWYQPPSSSRPTTSTPQPPPPDETTTSAEPTSMSLDVPDDTTPEDSEDTQKPEVKAYWTLHITLLVLSLSGPPFATIWTALLAALRNTRLPRAWWDADRQSVLCSPLVSEFTPLSLNRLPIAASFGVFDAEKDGAGLVSQSPEGQATKSNAQRKWVLADIDGFEEGCCEEELIVVVREKEEGGEGGMEILRIEKYGGGVVGRDGIRDVVALVEDRWREVREIIEGER
ncbi:MAG: hypothetical protein L6R40_006798 [Gallowayella cf. fulva]|nr:MAG: hypothetical protein L6R40_006798 [Xanthomendoza cf. fulva]